MEWWYHHMRVRLDLTDCSLLLLVVVVCRLKTNQKSKTQSLKTNVGGEESDGRGSSSLSFRSEIRLDQCVRRRGLVERQEETEDLKLTRLTFFNQPMTSLPPPLVLVTVTVGLFLFIFGSSCSCSANECPPLSNVERSGAKTLWWDWWWRDLLTSHLSHLHTARLHINRKLTTRRKWIAAMQQWRWNFCVPLFSTCSPITTTLEIT